ncbi:MAG: hypothetical protein EA412_00610 [Chitinophagaceae bacterium]|nr:MAG: hypothetical protein EA412_00610 [Chitinophagaceae bacterium]
MYTLCLRTFFFLAIFLNAGILTAFQPDLQFYRPNNKDGLNVFETSKTDTVTYDGLKVRIGGDFAIQFQGLNQSNELDSLVELGTNFNLPSANLNVDVQLYDGMRMHLRTYLSSKHHPESWVKGGHIQIDKFEFINSGFLSNIMNVTTLRFGLDQFNYGDAHFRRSDNASAIFNPFVGNYIMDAFSTEVFGEVLIQKNGFLGVLGLTNGKLNQSVVVNEKSDNQPSFYGKLGYDNQLTDDLRVRLTGSAYLNYGETTGTWLYGGDRAGSRYYNIMQTLDGDGSSFEGRFNPRFNQLTAFQFNPFIKFKGIEFFGIYEMAMNSEDLGSGAFTQLAAELLYRFGGTEQFYVGGRYNSVFGKMNENASTREINRFNVGAGWFITPNVKTKIEYVAQTYEGDGWAGSKFEQAEFSGFNIEAVISF